MRSPSRVVNYLNLASKRMSVEQRENRRQGGPFHPEGPRPPRGGFTSPADQHLVRQTGSIRGEIGAKATSQGTPEMSPKARTYLPLWVVRFYGQISI